MAINYGDLFDTLGALVKTADDVRTWQSDMATRLREHVTEAGTGEAEAVSSLLGQLATVQGYGDTVTGLVAAAAQSHLIAVMDAEQPLPSLTIDAAVAALRDHMTDDSETIERSTVSSSVTMGSGNTGDGTVVVSLVDGEGADLEMVFGETVSLEITNDAQLGSTSQQSVGSEVWTARGEASADRAGVNWPAGSGAVKTLATSSGLQEESGTAGLNVLNGGAFRDFTTTDTPDHWTVATGTPSTNIYSQSSGGLLSGDDALRFRGDSATLHKLTQTLNTSGGVGASAGDLKPSTRYALALYAKHGGVSPSAGTVRLSIDDGSSILDSGNAAVSIAFGTLGSSYALATGTFRTPAALPATRRAVVEFTTALSSGHDLVVSHAILVEMTPLYDRGPLVAVINGPTPFVRGDTAELEITQNGQGLLQQGLDRLLGLRVRGVQLPTDASPTRADTVID